MIKIKSQSSYQDLHLASTSNPSGGLLDFEPMRGHLDKSDKLFGWICSC